MSAPAAAVLPHTCTTKFGYTTAQLIPISSYAHRLCPELSARHKLPLTYLKETAPRGRRFCFAPTRTKLAESVPLSLFQKRLTADPQDLRGLRFLAAGVLKNLGDVGTLHLFKRKLVMNRAGSAIANGLR
jgi:hypothetical protein